MDSNTLTCAESSRCNNVPLHYPERPLWGRLPIVDVVSKDWKFLLIAVLEFTNGTDIVALSFKPPGRHVDPRCAHILPFSFHDKHLTFKTMETFTGGAITADVARDKINHPSNAFNAETAHESFTWGTEALKRPGGEYKYIFRVVRDEFAATVHLEDGDENPFCIGTDGQIIDAPDPLFYNLKLAIAGVMYASEASSLIDELYGDDDDNEAIQS